MKLIRFPPALTPPGLRGLGLADVAVLCLLGGAIATVVAFAREFEAPLSQAVAIDLRYAALPRYTLYSLSRGVLALLISYLFALSFGWAAAKSRAAERLLLPLLDILQSIPVLGFLPGLVLGLMSLFPTRNVGLELAAILMIFTAQAWNLALSFYNSLKGLPAPLREACKVAGWQASRTFWQLEVPAAAQGLVWNGMLSMAGGWVFLMVNEAFRLGDRDYRLPGIGSHMSVALDRGNTPAGRRPAHGRGGRGRSARRPEPVAPVGAARRAGLGHARVVRDSHLRARHGRRRGVDRVGPPGRGVDRPLAAAGPRAAAGDPGGRVVPRPHAVSAGDPAVRADRCRAGAGRRGPDGARGTVVHPVQRDLRGGRPPGAVEGRGNRVSAAAPGALARAVPPGGVPGPRDRLGDGGGRRAERVDRRRVHRGRGDTAHD